MKIKVVYLASGWNEKEIFAEKVKIVIMKMYLEDWEFKDIKISSKDKHSLLIFKKVIRK